MKIYQRLSKPFRIFTQTQTINKFNLSQYSVVVKQSSPPIITKEQKTEDPQINQRMQTGRSNIESIESKISNAEKLALKKIETTNKLIEKYNKTHVFQIQNMNQFEDKVINSEYPVIVMYHKDGQSKSESLKNVISKYIGKSGGKFSLALIDVDKSSEITGNVIYSHDIPSCFLMYKGSCNYEVRGYPSKSELKELLKQAVFFNQITNEENLINSFLYEGFKALGDKKYDDALYLFGEANTMKKWKGLYGSRILSSLAYIHALRGDRTLARQYEEEYVSIYGNQGLDSYEEEKLAYTRFIINQEYNHSTTTEGLEIDILNARNKKSEFNYDAALQICIQLLKNNYDDFEAHTLILQICQELGSSNSLVIKARSDIKQLLVNRSLN